MYVPGNIVVGIVSDVVTLFEEPAPKPAAIGRVAITTGNRVLFGTTGLRRKRTVKAALATMSPVLRTALTLEKVAPRSMLVGAVWTLVTSRSGCFSMM